MNGTHTVEPRQVADALGMDTHDLTKLLCGFASDALMTIETWLEKSYQPIPVEEFEAKVESARRHLDAAHAAWAAWTADNPDFGQAEPE